ncbi:hypothetical protein [Solwaraspora sp. WMMD792]|uniref:hypothetical protein n=1 Tax=Solwaraspora sp. WMMD792 TaxID=3016099 RepID=UPI002415DE87|nr:hypothetical protein [Solwaraspora sp. WMMD792]MDG4773276.1 hypothetical protein [Solwaraspora sp. WMMD792]
MGQGHSQVSALIESDHRRPVVPVRPVRPVEPVLRRRDVATYTGATVEHALRRFMQLGSVEVDDHDTDPGLSRVGRR